VDLKISHKIPKRISSYFLKKVLELRKWGVGKDKNILI